MIEQESEQPVQEKEASKTIQAEWPIDVEANRFEMRHYSNGSTERIR